MMNGNLLNKHLIQNNQNKNAYKKFNIIKIIYKISKIY